MLDAIGDLAVLGYPLIASYVAYKSVMPLTTGYCAR
jgi:UDP-3-O-acyl-N-acetylglucosamine deacetylase